MRSACNILLRWISIPRKTLRKTREAKQENIHKYEYNGNVVNDEDPDKIDFLRILAMHGLDPPKTGKHPEEQLVSCSSDHDIKPTVQSLGKQNPLSYRPENMFLRKIRKRKAPSVKTQPSVVTFKELKLMYFQINIMI